MWQNSYFLSYKDICLYFILFAIALFYDPMITHDIIEYGKIKIRSHALYGNLGKITFTYYWQITTKIFYLASSSFFLGEKSRLEVG